MKNLSFCFFNAKEKTLLIKSLESNRATHRKWSYWNFLIPLLIFLSPIGLALFLDFEKNKILQIFVNGNLPLIPVMILISLITINLSTARNEIKLIKSIESKTRIYAIIIGILAVLLYIAETLKDNSDEYLLYIGISSLPLLFSYFISKIYFLLQRQSIDNYKREGRRDLTETVLGK